MKNIKDVGTYTLILLLVYFINLYVPFHNIYRIRIAKRQMKIASVVEHIHKN